MHCNDFFVVCSEPNTILCHFFDKHCFCSLLIVHGSLYRFLASVGLTQAHFLNTYSLSVDGRVVVMVIHQSRYCNFKPLTH